MARHPAAPWRIADRAWRSHSDLILRNADVVAQHRFPHQLKIRAADAERFARDGGVGTRKLFADDVPKTHCSAVRFLDEVGVGQFADPTHAVHRMTLSKRS